MTEQISTRPPSAIPHSRAGTPGAVSDRRVTGIGRLLIAVYGVLALAAVGRSFVQIVTKFEQAPLAYVLSAIAAGVYVVATIALIKSGDRWYRAAVITVGFELLGVLVVGTLSVFDPLLFAHDTVWSGYGRGYVFIPLALPVLGLWWLRTRSPGREVNSRASSSHHSSSQAGTN